jgi:hypothetical protein
MYHRFETCLMLLQHEIDVENELVFIDYEKKK